MAGKDKTGRKKTRKEVSEYKNYVKHDVHDQQGTVTIDNDNLRGSNEMDRSSVLATNEPIIPLHYRIKKFIKNHTFESIIVTLLCAFFMWGAKTVLDLKVDVAVIQTRLGHLEEQVDGLDADSATREIIDLQIEAVKKDLSNTFGLEIAQIESQLDLIEQQIEYIEKSGTGNAG